MLRVGSYVCMFEGGADLDRDRDEDMERDDGSDLFDMGIN
jgi:hypothetical protein